MKVYERNLDKINEERARDEQREDKGNTKSETVRTYKLKKGKTTLRVMPPYSDKGVWFREFQQHQVNIGGRWIYATCARQFGLPCPFCDRGEELYNEATEEKRKEADMFRPKTQFLFNVVVLSDPEGDQRKNGIVPMQTGVKVKRQLLKYDADAIGDEGFGDITNLEQGFNLTVERVGNTEFTVTPSGRKRTNIAQTLSEDGYNLNDFTLHNLDEISPVLPLESMKALLEGANRVPGFPTRPVEESLDISKESVNITFDQVTEVPEVPDIGD